MKTKKTTTNTDHPFVLIATRSRPWTLIAGTLAAKDGDVYTLEDARMIVYFSSDAHGLLGVVARGPGNGARVSPRVDSVTVRGVELDAACTAAARAAIEAEPWH
jgi:hypothetical protein